MNGWQERKVEKVRAIGVDPAPLGNSRGISNARGYASVRRGRAKVHPTPPCPPLRRGGNAEGRREQVRYRRGSIGARVLCKPLHPTPLPPLAKGEMPRDDVSRYGTREVNRCACSANHFTRPPPAPPCEGGEMPRNDVSRYATGEGQSVRACSTNHFTRPPLAKGGKWRATM
jgi:hypothetical protein